MCLQEPVLVNQLLRLLDSRGHVEYVVDVGSGGLQLHKTTVHHHGDGWHCHGDGTCWCFLLTSLMGLTTSDSSAQSWYKCSTSPMLFFTSCTIFSSSCSVCSPFCTPSSCVCTALRSCDSMVAYRGRIPIRALCIQFEHYGQDSI